MLPFDEQKVWVNARKATDEDLLDRVTIFREGLEPEAIPILEAELRSRGIDKDQIRAHAEGNEKDILRGPEGTPLKCSFCRRPAIAQAWGWHRWWGWVPLFPRLFNYCRKHQPGK